MFAHHAVLTIVVAPNVDNVDVLEQLLNARHRLLVAMFVMTIAGAEPRPIEVEDLGGKGDAFGISPERIIYADKEISHLERVVDRAAFCIVAGEVLGFVIEDLRREDALLESDNLSHLVGCGRRRGLRMAKGGVDRL